MTSGADFLQLDVQPVPRGRRTGWLADTLRAAITSGQLAEGSRLPATRVLSEELGISRGTVIEVFQRLTEEGLLTANRGAGTVVAPIALRVDQPAVAVRRDPATDRISVSDGLPDLASFPRTAWLSAERQVLARCTGTELGYPLPQGAVELRIELAKWLARSRGVHVEADRIIITAGVTGAVSLLAQVLGDRGLDTVAVEDPGAEGNRRVLDYWLNRVLPVPVDSQGIMVSELATTEARVAVVTPAHQFPTGVVLSPQRRRDLIGWAEHRDGLIVEDDYDAEYRYDRSPVRAMHGLAPNAIAYVSSLSKLLAPALRLGWLIAPPQLHDDLVTKRWATDLGMPILPQLTLAELLRKGVLERHLRTMRARHRQRRDAAVRAIADYLPGATVHGIAAGVHILVMLAAQADDTELARLAAEHGIVVAPLSVHRREPGPPGLIIGYGAHPPARLREAIRTIGTLLPAATRQ